MAKPRSKAGAGISWPAEEVEPPNSIFGTDSAGVTLLDRGFRIVIKQNCLSTETRDRVARDGGDA